MGSAKHNRPVTNTAPVPEERIIVDANVEGGTRFLTMLKLRRRVADRPTPVPIKEPIVTARVRTWVQRIVRESG